MSGPPDPLPIARRIEADWEDFLKTLKVIAPYRKTHRGKGPVEIPCPVCETGTLHFVINGSNGHCHAACSTDKCVRWIE